MLQKKALQTVRGPARKAVNGDWRKLQMRSFLICTAQNKDGWGMWHVGKHEKNIQGFGGET